MLGPVAFVVGWSTLGASRANYDPTDDAISRLAELGAASRPAMTAAFVCFGVAMALYAQALRKTLSGWAWAAATTTGVATLGVAAFPLGGAGGGVGHAIFASIAYAALAATPLFAAAPLARSGQSRWAKASLVIALVSGACLLATVLGTHRGLFQRAGLTIADVWVVGSALWLCASAHRDELIGV